MATVPAAAEAASVQEVESWESSSLPCCDSASTSSGFDLDDLDETMQENGRKKIKLFRSGAGTNSTACACNLKLPVADLKACTQDSGTSRSDWTACSSSFPDPQDTFFGDQRWAKCGAIARATKAKPPGASEELTVVFTDIQGSTSLWELDEVAMQEAQQLHDDTLRRLLAQRNGYEVTTEGDSFQIVFHTAADALAFCLDAQLELLCCRWSPEILALEPAAPSPDGGWRGLRVRMGMHTGVPSMMLTDQLTGRSSYAGPAIDIGRAIGGACHGGQIVISAATLAAIHGQADALGKPKIVDLGFFAISADGKALANLRLYEISTRALLQDDPSSPSRPTSGRAFPALKGLRSLTPNFKATPIELPNVSCSELEAVAHCTRQWTGCGGCSKLTSTKTPAHSRDVTLVRVELRGPGNDEPKRSTSVKAALDAREEVLNRLMFKRCGDEVNMSATFRELAFHDPIDAAGFCMDVQLELLSCRLRWPQRLHHNEDLDSVLQSFQVAIGAHSGRQSYSFDAFTGDRDYDEESLAVVRAIARACPVGQTVLSAKTFAAISGLLKHLGGPSVVHLGKHRLLDSAASEGLVGKHVEEDLYHVVPEVVAHSNPSGAGKFDLQGLTRLSPGFHEAPSGDTVTLCFVMIRGMDTLAAVCETAVIQDCLDLVRNTTRTMLAQHRSGYECQEIDGNFMLSFGDLEEAIAFATRLQEALSEAERRPLDPGRSLQKRRLPGLGVGIGILEGPYASRCPHPTTGRADYFGSLVNRTARIASQAGSGETLLGGDASLRRTLAGRHLDWQLRLKGMAKLRGVRDPIKLYKVVPAHVEDGDNAWTRASTH
eukprot:TRINITY_DN9149_c0_g1_i1.p1 TRINITY_DN9149_c0_g1~~TRINITY_DN9149_c0_g1_i1.p1  ORF type:complete len:831 (-),score=127.93 TRINITY_DN9149_c0_g1_i1:443-2935(-)